MVRVYVKFKYSSKYFPKEFYRDRLRLQREDQEVPPHIGASHSLVPQYGGGG